MTETIELPYSWGRPAPRPGVCASCKIGACYRCWSLHSDRTCACGVCYEQRIAK